MTVEELRQISGRPGSLVTCTPVINSMSQRFWHYPHYSRMPGFKIGRWPALAMDLNRNQLFEELVSSCKGGAALISVLTDDGDRGPHLQYLMAFTDVSDAVMFRLSWTT